MPTDLESLTEMGFDENRAQKALAKSGYKGVMAAIDWLSAHQDDPDIDEPFDVAPGHVLTAETTPVAENPGETDDCKPMESGEGQAVASSIKCDDCGKLLNSDANVQMHAARTGHSNFSESTEEIKPLTEEEKKQQAQALQEKMKAKRDERIKKEKEEALEKERIRRKQGRDYSEMKQKMADEEMKKIAEDIRRAKKEEALAKQKVKEQIARDRANRANLFPSHSGKEDISASTSSPSKSPAATVVTAPVKAPTKEYDETRLQIRLITGEPITETFSVNEQLAGVRLFVQRKLNKEFEPPCFTFMTTFPRKVFSEDDMQVSLKGLNLVPSAVLMMKEL